MNHICFWGQNDPHVNEFIHHFTRCTIGANGKPEGLPEGAFCILIFEFAEGKEPTIYRAKVPDHVTIENNFPPNSP